MGVGVSNLEERKPGMTPTSVFEQSIVPLTGEESHLHLPHPPDSRGLDSPALLGEQMKAGKGSWLPRGSRTQAV